MSVASSISFNNFCQLCTKINNASHEKKFEILRSYIDNWKKKANELHQTNSNLNGSFFPVLRFLLPQLDRERGAYGVKESTLAKIYIRILSLPKDGWDAMRLLNFRIPKTSSNETTDFAEVAYWILKNRCTEGHQLSIEEVNNHLDAIAQNHAANEPRKVDAELISLLKTTAADEQKWLIRILLKEIKVGIGQNGILKCYHPDAKDLFEATNDLRKVSETLYNEEIRLNEIVIELFSAFKPMLSEECDIPKIDVCLKKSMYYVETKLDGERFQIHFKEGNYKYFSRNGFDFTSNFGASINEGTLTPRIASRFRPLVHTCILDGEMMSWNIETEMFSTKGNNIDVKNLKNDTHVPCFCVFDILFYNDEVITNQPLNCRLKILEQIIEPLEGAICFVPRKLIASKEEIIDCLNEAIDKREEGIVIKDYMSVYKPNIRKNGGWYKIKPEYIEGLSDPLDLLIIGGYFGSGRRKGIISHFLLGVAVEIEGKRKSFYSTAKVGSGYTWVELEKLLSKLQQFWNATKPGIMPPNIEWTKEKPDVWIEPNKSFVLEIRAAEIIRSDLFKTGFTLRFPRVLKIREDKSWQDCLTLNELEEKRKMCEGKLASHHFFYSESESLPKKKKIKSSIDLAPQFKRVSEPPTKISNLLGDKEICVFSGFGDFNKKDVEKKLMEHGANVVLNPGNNTFCILAESESTARIKNIIACASHDIIYSSWFVSQLKEKGKEFSELEPINFLAMSNKTKLKFSKIYDEYGDHFTKPINKETLQFLLKKVENKHELNLIHKINFDLELFNGSNPYNIFQFCTAYFDEFGTISNPSSEYLSDLNICKFDFRFRGGKISAVINDDVTHVVIHSKDICRLDILKQINEKRKNRFFIVTEKWIQLSIKNNALENISEI